MSPQKKKTPNLDSVTTINEDGSHYTLEPADVRGRFTLWRRLVGWGLLLAFFVLPWVKVGKYPAFFFDVANLRYHALGLTISVQDLWVFFFIITGLGFSLFVVTAVLGRVWCGWTCPYTLLNEHVFRRIERLIDGDAQKRRKLAAAPWTGEKVFKRVVKWAIYVFMALAVSHTFFAYFQSTDRMGAIMRTSPTENLTLFLMVYGLAAILLFCFAWFREQFCVVMCPYGRLQSAMTDDDSLIVGYDVDRGEPRGKASDPSNGDCIDCRRCVQVCPTGIDIRNGLQMECIGCAACIDACDEIMLKLNRPTGLVRYDSLRGLEEKKRKFWRPRIFIYGVLGLLGATVFSLAFIYKAKSFNAQITRIAGAPFVTNETSVSNLAQVRLINKRQEPVSFELNMARAPEGLNLIVSEESLSLAPEEEKIVRFTMSMNGEQWDGPFETVIEIRSTYDNHTYMKKFPFLGPAPNYFKRLEKQREEEGAAAGDSVKGNG